jgi:hypothetical protein
MGTGESKTPRTHSKIIMSKKHTLFCAQTDIAIQDFKDFQMSRLHFRVFCKLAIVEKLDLGNMTNSQSDFIESQMMEDQWVDHAITHKLLYTN